MSDETYTLEKYMKGRGITSDSDKTMDADRVAKLEMLKGCVNK